MTDALLLYAGVILMVFLFTEEFQKGWRWAGGLLKSHPRFRLLAYPLAALLLIIAALLIAKTLSLLFGSLNSYE